jgi:hypothetical protein
MIKQADYIYMFHIKNHWSDLGDVLYICTGLYFIQQAGYQIKDNILQNISNDIPKM